MRAGVRGLWSCLISSCMCVFGVGLQWCFAASEACPGPAMAGCLLCHQGCYALIQLWKDPVHWCFIFSEFSVLLVLCWADGIKFFGVVFKGVGGILPFFDQSWTFSDAPQPFLLKIFALGVFWAIPKGFKIEKGVPSTT